MNIWRKNIFGERSFGHASLKTYISSENREGIYASFWPEAQPLLSPVRAKHHLYDDDLKAKGRAPDVIIDFDTLDIANLHEEYNRFKMNNGKWAIIGHEDNISHCSHLVMNLLIAGGIYELNPEIPMYALTASPDGIIPVLEEAKRWEPTRRRLRNYLPTLVGIVTHCEYAFLCSSLSIDDGASYILPKWKKLVISKPGNANFKGVAYYNDDTKCVVMVLKFNSPGQLSTFFSITRQTQMKSAREFYELVQHNMRQRGKDNYALSATGYSYGAVLAEYLAWRYDLLAVTFESPGAYETCAVDSVDMQGIRKQVHALPSATRIYSYLRPPNRDNIPNTISSSNTHLGRMLEVTLTNSFNEPVMKEFREFFQTQKIANNFNWINFIQRWPQNALELGVHNTIGVAAGHYRSEPSDQKSIPLQKLVDLSRFTAHFIVAGAMKDAFEAQYPKMQSLHNQYRCESDGRGDGMLYTMGQLSVFELESAIRAILKEYP